MARAWHSQSHSAAYRFADHDSYAANWELTPGERVCPPFAPSRGRVTFRAVIALLVVLGGWWAMFAERGSWSDWLQIASAMMVSSGDAVPDIVEQPSDLAAAPQISGPSEEALEVPSAFSPPEPATETNSEPAAIEVETIASAPSDEEIAADEPASEPLPPPTADPDDPYQARALAVGLHPGLSRVLLTQLTDTDYRNAGIAIRIAIAETPDSDAFTYPRQRKPELALFRVHFVRGAAPGCRRYVVTVTKNGWSTTALPMEKCGQQVARRRSQ